MEFMLFGYEIAAWQTFAAMGVIFMFLEVFAPGFVLLPIGVACLLTIPAALFFESWLSQLSFFGVNLFIVFAVFVKFIKPKLTKETYKTNLDSMVGSTAQVTETIESNGTGYVKLYGDRWQAYSHSAEEFIVGEKVKITKLDGNKVIIKKIN